ncbi:MAG: NAD(P)-dependent oxidoreductase [Gammaproteobacteria bacterium]|nr:NAD(P)-dependent oxidoreductase [Gammaproteobacteria bacterium]
MISADRDTRIVITGGAGLIGQNLVVGLLEKGYRRLTVIDKSHNNLATLSALHPTVQAVEADLACAGDWCQLLRAAQVVVILHAQIGGLQEREFQRNNVEATRAVLDALADNRDCYIVQVSSSVVNSRADDFYTRSKLEQEKLVTGSAHPWLVLRPTLMFGWFDRKHFGWLSRFMGRSPVFPIPGNGLYLRQPLYARDFCSIIMSAIEHRPSGECVNISGKEKIPYLDIVKTIKRVTGSRSLVLPIPYTLFHWLLRIYAWFDRNPPFTVSQLEALVIDETFEEVDWEARFAVRATPLAEALKLTFKHPRYSQVVLEF